ncbi:membrane protease subunit (stomatin/prohibitin family) [Dysgonomonas sp. PFB1-18]|uniref:SPFH domain-containing protein n=1 Tax=unclassified Dysgonomonas TaxID=2630389 RepID=UPI0024756F19|nr:MULTISPECIES: SPFH domain-containing protein [unclassified Dysgonomonas]MDH6308657.1 membrane protease subunit (stomatin/prohibitin family) [Dysgonomonas sp. PF1-14]MDH6338158.1 membrane protease subunit (stomatin/prohibitin family) [Dysgonomonas sp. PF1-16]MDH6379655.1 membrane protease subunit (stomatin/prohibitin family) [Dysgonomonas sp. PFB1-18]MDH6396985.1 membrane protease subunit (stomatin/prohibitin family) [Dysgonomonas sp. PF1-23]
MTLFDKEQLRSVIQWNEPQDWEIFRRVTDKGDELKNVSKLIVHPGQGCIFTYEGKVEGVFEEEGTYSLETENKPFFTTIKKVLYGFESEHKVGLWFFRTADILNIRWGTRIPITYNDPVYSFPVNLRAYGNYSIKINQPEYFFRNVVAGKENYYAYDLQELFISRISQPISSYLANSKFSYADVDSKIEEIAAEAKNKSRTVFNDLGFSLLDFRIEGTSFDDETNQRIAGISDVQADVKAAQLAGIDFSELQKLKAMRDAANNEGIAGAGVGMLTGMNLGQPINQPQVQDNDIKGKLRKLKDLFDEGLMDEEEYKSKKAKIIDEM